MNFFEKREKISKVSESIFISCLFLTDKYISFMDLANLLWGYPSQAPPPPPPAETTWFMDGSKSNERRCHFTFRVTHTVSCPVEHFQIKWEQAYAIPLILIGLVHLPKRKWGNLLCPHMFHWACPHARVLFMIIATTTFFWFYMLSKECTVA